MRIRNLYGPENLVPVKQISAGSCFRFSGGSQLYMMIVASQIRQDKPTEYCAVNLSSGLTNFIEATRLVLPINAEILVDDQRMSI